MHLCERMTAEGSQVDRDAGVIRGVKLLGAASSNRRKYSPKAIEEASKLYEGAPVNVDHPKPGSPGDRSVTEGLGWISNVQMREGVPYGDLNVFKSHPAAPLILEAAERNPKRFGMSHNAQGEVEVKEGANVVTSVHKVLSVDVVQNPATTRGFYESEQDSTVAELLQEAGGDWPILLEDSGIAAYGQMPAMRPPMPGMPGMQPDPSEQQNSAVGAAFKAIAMAIFDEPGPVPAKLKKLKTILQTQEEIMGAPAADPTDNEDPAESGDPEEEPMPADPAADPNKKKPAPPVQESAELKELVTLNRKLLEKIEARETRDHCIELLDAKGREITSERIKALIEADSDDKRANLVESYPPRPAAGNGGNRPRFSPAAGNSDDAGKYPERNPFLRRTA